MRIWKRNNSAEPQVREEGEGVGEGGGAPGTRAEIPLQSIVKTMVSQDVALQPMEVCSGADSSHTLWKAHARTDNSV